MRVAPFHFAGLVRMSRYIGETCNAKDGLVKVLCEAALSDPSGGRSLTNQEALSILRHRVTLHDSEMCESQDILDPRDKDDLEKHEEFVKAQKNPIQEDFRFFASDGSGSLCTWWCCAGALCDGQRHVSDRTTYCRG